MMIHISRDGEQFGPYTPEQVQEYLASGSLVATDMAWHEGAEDGHLSLLVRRKVALADGRSLGKRDADGLHRTVRLSQRGEHDWTSNLISRLEATHAARAHHSPGRPGGQRARQ